MTEQEFDRKVEELAGRFERRVEASADRLEEEPDAKVERKQAVSPGGEGRLGAMGMGLLLGAASLRRKGF